MESNRNSNCGSGGGVAARALRSVVACGLALAAFVPVRAFANYDSGGSASVCVPQTSVAASSLEFSYLGVLNDDPVVAATLSCGTVRLTSASPASLYLDYSDGSQTDSVSCVASVAAWNGALEWSESHSSSRTGTGTGFLHWSIPSGSTGYVSIKCTIPALGSGALSSIIGFNLQ